MPNLYLIKVGFLTFGWLDFLDILVVGWLLYQLYQLLKGSFAVKIFVGIGLLLLASQLFKLLGMTLLAEIFRRIIEAGFVGVVVIFQPEIRRFLLLLGNSTMKQRRAMIDRVLGRASDESNLPVYPQVKETKRALLRMSKTRTGALIVCLGDVEENAFITGGTALDSTITEGLLLSIFQKGSPLHDGAITIRHRRILRASTILPVSENAALPKSVGLRHRAAVGITEKTEVVCFIVSEENGYISFAKEGVLERRISEERLEELLREYLR
ncbi:TIGR00159 family protein [Lewinellaceae bacterium SD302]|nr:TIGR00159 family protein [Lewinellaceae bacterium SD302]